MEVGGKIVTAYSSDNGKSWFIPKDRGAKRTWVLEGDDLVLLQNDGTSTKNRLVTGAGCSRRSKS